MLNCSWVKIVLAVLTVRVEAKVEAINAVKEDLPSEEEEEQEMQ